MITRRTQIQLIFFVVITLLGVSFVGARYAQLDRLVIDRSYDVTVQLVDSGGIFEGAEVTYRGVTIGRVGELRLTDAGVDAVIRIENEFDDIPEDSRAIVANKSAVGEQYIQVQPQVDDGPVLEDGSVITSDRTSIPITTTQLLLNADRLVNSVDKQDLRTVIDELGTAFNGTGENLGQIIDTATSFIEKANANFDLTRALIRDSNVVLNTQLDKASAINSFARDLALVSDTLVASDGDLRRVIANGSAAANQLRRFLEDNEVDLGQLINNLVTTGDVVRQHLDGLEMALVLYPYAAAGAYVVLDRADDTGLINGHFGIVLETEPHACRAGYDPAERRSPRDTSNAPMDMDARCTEPPSKSNARGSSQLPRVAPGLGGRVIGSYDRETGTVDFAESGTVPTVTYDGGASIYGEDSWKWMLMHPLSTD